LARNPQVDILHRHSVCYLADFEFHAKYDGSAIEGRRARHVRYQIRQRMRKLVEEIGAWIKMVRGVEEVDLRRIKGERKVPSPF